MGAKLSKRQKEIYDFIGLFDEQNGYSPTYREIAEHLGLRSAGTVKQHVDALAAKGAIEKLYNTNRSLKVLPIGPAASRSKEEGDGVRAVRLPLSGEVAAGRPIDALYDGEGIAVPAEFLRQGGGESYVLRVRGNSMVEEQIRDGDFIVVEARSDAAEGETVVAVVDGPAGPEATVKKFHREPDGRIRLEPASPLHEPLFCSPGEVEVRGVVVAVLRKY